MAGAQRSWTDWRDDILREWLGGEDLTSASDSLLWIWYMRISNPAQYRCRNNITISYCFVYANVLFVKAFSQCTNS